MVGVCIKHRMTCYNGVWQEHQVEIYKLNFTEPVVFCECPKCLAESNMVWYVKHRMTHGDEFDGMGIS